MGIRRHASSLITFNNTVGRGTVPIDLNTIPLAAIERIEVLRDGAHPSVHLHFTPTYSSWLNQVELWFAKIERDVIAGGVFTSVPDLKRKLMRYVRQYNKKPSPVKWKFFEPSRPITPDSIVTGH